jgi:hypothetical protein
MHGVDAAVSRLRPADALIAPTRSPCPCVRGERARTRGLVQVGGCRRENPIAVVSLGPR